MYYCKKCGAALTPEKRFCSQCGTPVEEIASTAQPTTPQAETPAASRGSTRRVRGRPR